MAKSGKEMSVNPNPLTLPEDTSRIKKHIALFCDKLGKGARLVDGLKDKKEKPVLMSTLNTAIEANENEESRDQGTQDEMLSLGYKAGKKVKKDRTVKSLGLPEQDTQEAGLFSELSPHGESFRSKETEYQRHIESMVPDLDSMTEEPAYLMSEDNNGHGDGVHGRKAEQSYFGAKNSYYGHGPGDDRAYDDSEDV